MSDLTLESIVLVAQMALTGGLLVLLVRLIAIAVSNGFDTPFLSTPHEYLQKIAEALAIRPGDVVYDLGSGDGRLILYCATRYPQATFIGIERNAMLVAYATIKKRFGVIRNASFKQADFFETDFADATRIYTYLLPVALNKLFLNTPHMPKDFRLVSRAYRINKKSLASVELSATPGSHGEHLLHIYEYRG